LFLTQPALSHQLADLERQVGTAIFNRIGKRLVPTAAGARLLETALETLQSLGDMERELKLFASGKIGALRVTSQCFTSYHWLPLVLPEFLALHPHVEFEIMPEFSANALAALTSGAADLALVYDPPAHKHVESFKLFDDEMVLIAAPGHPLAAKPFVAAQDFADVHLLLHYRDPEGSSLFQRVLIPNQVTPAKVSAVRLTEAIVALAAAGIGCAVVPRWTVAPALREGKLAATRVTEAGLYRGWYCHRWQGSVIAWISSGCCSAARNGCWSSGRHSMRCVPVDSPVQAAPCVGDVRAVVTSVPRVQLNQTVHVLRSRLRM
jgi:LysR family transcriptional regulator for metE and metH